VAELVDGNNDGRAPTPRFNREAPIDDFDRKEDEPELMNCMISPTDLEPMREAQLENRYRGHETKTNIFLPMALF
jgi:hypothetical protein